jgi:hypothetical protein
MLFSIITVKKRSCFQKEENEKDLCSIGFRVDDRRDDFHDGSKSSGRSASAPKRDQIDG